MKILILGDPIEKLHAAGDSSFAILRAAKRMVKTVAWATASQVQMRETQIWVEYQPCEGAAEGEAPRLGEKQVSRLKEFQAVLIRKDPPFNSSYQKLCWLLCLAEKQTYFCNAPSLLLRYHEKLVPQEAVLQGFLKPKDILPTFYRAPEAFKAAATKSKSDEYVAKPFFGFGGRSISKGSLHDLSESAVDYSKNVLQPYHSAVETQGDVRAFFFGGRYMGGFTRRAPQGSFVTNLAQGGRAEKFTPSKSQKAVLEKLGRFLKKVKIDLAGADLIGDKITEVNITSPTGFVSVKTLYGIDLGGKFVEFLQGRV